MLMRLFRCSSEAEPERVSFGPDLIRETTSGAEGQTPDMTFSAALASAYNSGRPSGPSSARHFPGILGRSTLHKQLMQLFEADLRHDGRARMDRPWSRLCSHPADYLILLTTTAHSSTSSLRCSGCWVCLAVPYMCHSYAGCLIQPSSQCRLSLT